MSDLNEILKQPTKPRRKLGKVRNAVMAMGSVLLVIAAGATVAFLVIKNNPGIIGLSNNKEALETTPQEELNLTIEQVGKLMLLPNEIPTLATVTDLEQLEGQDFFENAQIGDKVLIYTETKKAILYRPSEDKIIEVGTVTVEDVSEQEVTDQTEETTPTPFGQPDLSPTAPPGQRPTGPEATPTVTPTVEPELTPTITPSPTVTP